MPGDGPINWADHGFLRYPLGGNDYGWRKDILHRYVLITDLPDGGVEVGIYPLNDLPDKWTRQAYPPRQFLSAGAAFASLKVEGHVN
jgi:hypothetical protein